MDKVKQREWAVEMYGDPKKQTGWVAKFNSWFAIYEEMTRHPTQTQSTYVLYKIQQKKAQQKEIFSLPGVFIPERNLEKIAVHNDSH